MEKKKREEKRGMDRRPTNSLKQKREWEKK